MLTMLEEIVLLAVDERTGKLRSSHRIGAGYAMGGALFFDLALAGKIDTGTAEIQIVDAAPTGNTAMDHFLAEMAKQPELTTVRSWIQEAFGYRDYLEEFALASLVEHGVLRHETSRKLWIIDVSRFPTVDNKPVEHVRRRLAMAILDDAIPEPRDIMLVSVADASDLLEYALSREDVDRRRERIALLANLETIGREVAEAIRFLDQNIRTATPHLA
ncbi:MAG TPA: GPP34 family phosphoprotein [Bryobacteraceae bacterium]|nr:GPP34 family phosphoprotein [Bryobacteraceae bacterium]